LVEFTRRLNELFCRVSQSASIQVEELYHGDDVSCAAAAGGVRVGRQEPLLRGGDDGGGGGPRAGGEAEAEAGDGRGGDGGGRGEEGAGVEDGDAGRGQGGGRLHGAAVWGERAELS
jgi:hypothetical protein